jgi:GxxExxY protein
MAVRRDPRTHNIIGAAMKVHGELGSGFLEPVYHEALKIEFAEVPIPFEHEVELPVFYKGQRLKTIYRADFVCYGSIIVEIKALDQLTGVERSQILNYLKATGCEIGLLLNFGAESLQYERFANSKWQPR